jgi:hypothetical protein
MGEILKYSMQYGIGVVFLVVFLFFIVIPFFKKTLNELSSNITKSLDSFNEITKTLDMIIVKLDMIAQGYSNFINFEQSEIIINSFIAKTKLFVINFFMNTLHNNNLKDNEDSIRKRVIDFVEITLQRNRLDLKNFNFSNMTLDKVLCDNIDKEKLIELIFNSLYLKNNNKKEFIRDLDSAFDKIKNDSVKTITDLK